MTTKSWPFAGAGALQAKLIKGARLTVSKRAPHGLPARDRPDGPEYKLRRWNGLGAADPGANDERQRKRVLQMTGAKRLLPLERAW